VIKLRLSRHPVPNKFVYFVFDDQKAPPQGELTFGKYEFAYVRIPYSQSTLPRLYTLVTDATHAMFGAELATEDQVLSLVRLLAYLLFCIYQEEGVAFQH